MQKNYLSFNIRYYLQLVGAVPSPWWTHLLIDYLTGQFTGAGPGGWLNI